MGILIFKENDVDQESAYGKKNDIHVSNVILQEKATELASEMKIADFKATTGWLSVVAVGNSATTSDKMSQRTAPETPVFTRIPWTRKNFKKTSKFQIAWQLKEEISTFADGTGVTKEGIESQVTKEKTRKLATTKRRKGGSTSCDLSRGRTGPVIRRYLEEDGGRIWPTFIQLGMLVTHWPKRTLGPVGETSENRGPVSRQVCYDKDPSLLKSRCCEHRT